MGTPISSEEMKRVVDFHGHRCPGLAIGIRVSELCLRELGHNNESPLTAVCETDSCGVDAVQLLTGCSIGKGNLILKNYGKMAFNFFRRNDGKGFRALLSDKTTGPAIGRMFELMAKNQSGAASPEEKKESVRLRAENEQKYLEADLDELFIISKPVISMPAPARIMRSVTCEVCREKTMESCIRRFGGRFMCKPCLSVTGGGRPD